MSRYRTLTGPWKVLFVALTWLGIAVSVYNIFRLRVAGVEMFNIAYLAAILGCFLPLLFLLLPATKRAPRERVPWYDVLLALASVSGPAFVIVFAEQMSASDWEVAPPVGAFILGIVTWLVVLEALRRAGGIIIAGLVGLFSVYPLFAAFMPSILFGKNYSLKTLVAYHFLGTSSIFGLPLQVFGDLLVGFIVFGSALQITGAGKFFIDLAQGLLGRTRGGPAMVAVLSSSFLGMLSGSAVSNVISTGSFTIPAMKRLGYPPHVAGAVESCASTGGVLMPPVMGATAFIMAAFLRVPYAEVALAAAIPMLIYYVSLLAQVYLFAQRHGLSVLPASEIPSLRKTLQSGWYYLGSLVVLIYLLFYVRVEAWAPFYAAVFLFACSFLRRETRPTFATAGNFTRNIGEALTELAPMLAGIGLLIGGLSLTGVAQSLASDLAVLTGGNLYLLLVLGALGALVMGMGMPITPCYIFLAMTFAPTLVNIGIDPMAAHLFFLYWGMLSFITPPVCIAVFAASTLAGSSPMKTGYTAMRLGVVIFIIPFFFVLNPNLIGHGPWPGILESVLTAVVGALLVATGLGGHALRIGKLGLAARVIFFAAGLLLLYPWWLTEVLGAALALVAILWAYSESGLARASHRNKA